MKPRHLTWLVTAAALSAGLSAYAQQPPANETDPARPSPEAAPTGTQDRDIRATDPATAPSSDRDMNTAPMGTSPEDRTRTGDDMGREYDREGRAEQPKKKKRSFWDRITGRNKHLDAETRPQP